MGRTIISISHESGEAIYRQLRRAIKHEIATGALSPHSALPSSREMAKDLGISRNTVNAAYQELLDEGILESRPRRGYFVNSEMLPRLVREDAVTNGESHMAWEQWIRKSHDAGIPRIEKVPDWTRFPYPFIAGQVDVRSFPRLAWARMLREALDPPHLQYSLRDAVDADDPMLVEMLCQQLLPMRGIEVNADQVLITMGSQQGLDLLATTLLTSGDRVAMEDPGYPDARHSFLHAGARLVPVKVDSDGLIPPSDLSGIRLVYLTPSHQSPTNVTLTRARRNRLIELAEVNDTLLIEDDYDSEFRYKGKPTPAMKSLPHTNRVIYLGSFSKFLAPGLRLGYLVGDAELVRELRRQRRYRIRHVPGHSQRAMALMIQAGQYQRTVRRHRTQLQRKWSALSEALSAQFDWAPDPPPGGVSLWVTGPPELDCVALARDCLERGVIIERGDVYFSHPAENRNHFRVGFAAIPLASIEPGVNALAKVVHGLLDGAA